MFECSKVRVRVFKGMFAVEVSCNRCQLYRCQLYSEYPYNKETGWSMFKGFVSSLICDSCPCLSEPHGHKGPFLGVHRVHIDVISLP